MSRKQNFHLVSAVAGQFFYFGATGVQMMMPIAAALLSGHQSPMAYYDDEDDDDSPKAPEYHQKFKGGVTYIPGTEYYQNYPVLLEGGILMIPLQGPVMQNDYCGRPGLSTIRNWYQLALADPNVKAILEYVNSPGGAVFGTAELAGVKLTAKKLIYSLVEGLCCSAAQWIAATSNKVFATSVNCMFGSIGTMTTYSSTKKYYADLGIEIVDVYSKASPGKNFTSREAEKGNFKPLEDGLLFQMDENFMNAMKQLRPNLSAEALEGFEYLSGPAQQNGLMDGIATFQEVYDMLLADADASTSEDSTVTPLVTNDEETDLNSQQNGLSVDAVIVDEGLSLNTVVTPQNSNTTMSTMSKVKASAINMLAGLGALNMFKTDGSEKNEEELVGDLQAQFNTLTAENKRLAGFEAQVTTLQGQLTTVTGERDEFKQKYEAAQTELGKTPSVKPTTASQEAEVITPEAGGDGLPNFVE